MNGKRSFVGLLLILLVVVSVASVGAGWKWKKGGAPEAGWTWDDRWSAEVWAD